MTLVLKNWLRSRLKNLVNRNELTVHLDNNIDIVSEQRLRRQIASQYLSGQGIEVGALHSPLDIPDDVKVSYVDRMPVDELRKQYPELAGYDLVKVDIIDDGENLLSIADSSVDFVNVTLSYK